MQHYAAFHLGLHCLQKYSFRGFQNTNGSIFGPVHAILVERQQLLPFNWHGKQSEQIIRFRVKITAILAIFWSFSEVLKVIKVFTEIYRFFKRFSLGGLCSSILLI